MAGRDRIAAVRRARERQARIEAATTRVAQAQRRVEQAESRRQKTLDSANARLADTELGLAREIEALVTSCGSTGFAAEILGLDERQIRKITTRARRNGRDDPNKSATAARSTTGPPAGPTEKGGSA